MRSILRLQRNGYSGPFFVGLTLLLCGVQLLLGYDTFSTSESYSAMEGYATEGGWGLLMVGTSLHIIIGSLKRKPDHVAVGGLVSAFAWLIITVSVGLGSPQGLLFPISAVLCLRSLSIYREFMSRRDDPHLTGPWSNADKHPPSP